MKKRKLKFGLIILFIAIVCGLVWGGDFLSFQPMPEAIKALESDEQVTVTRVFVPGWLNYYYVFEPTAAKPAKGFIIYPGALVDPGVYAPTARRIAAKGYRTILVSMPFNLAILGYRRADTIMKKFPEIKKWALGGHSLGGAMACRYAKNFSTKISGVVLWAAYPSDAFRIDDKNISVISIYGTEDDRVLPDDIETSKLHLPKNTQFVQIDGGNHIQFGWYEEEKEYQKGEEPSHMTRERQQDIVVKSTVDFLGQI